MNQSECVNPHPDGGIERGTHSFDKDGFCNYCGAKQMSTQPSPGQIAAEKIAEVIICTFRTEARIAQIIDSVIDSASLPAAGEHKPDEDGVCEACGTDLLHCEPAKVSTQPDEINPPYLGQPPGVTVNKFGEEIK